MILGEMQAADKRNVRDTPGDSILLAQSASHEL